VNLVDLPELGTLTEGGRAGYMLGLAFLTSQELGIPIQTKDRGTYVLIKADGLFVANVFKNAPRGRNIVIGFKSIGFDEILRANWDFETPAIKLLGESAMGECEFSAGWYRNDAREIDFLKRTCSGLHALVRARLQGVQQVAPKDATPASPLPAEASMPPMVPSQIAAAEPLTKHAMDPEAGQSEINRRSQFSLGDIREFMSTLRQRESNILEKLDRNARNGHWGISGAKSIQASNQSIQADLVTERQELEAMLTEVRKEIGIQAAALAIVESHERKLEEAKRQLQAQEQARKMAAREAVRDKFEASARGKLLYVALQASLMNRFLENHPSPLPSQREAGKRAVDIRAKCIVRYTTPKDPSNMSADEQAAINMMITDLPLRGSIRNQSLATVYALMDTQCMADGR
jgi:hypothetical protein